jgi:PTS system nitrogen regulatory IIA component
MKINELINENLIVAELKGENKNQVLEELVNHMVLFLKRIDPDELLKVLIDREKLGSTGIGSGIAIPHGKLKGIDNILLAFGKSPKGINFDAIDGNPVHLIFLLVAPLNSAGIHLKTLARLSRLLKDNNFRDKLLKAPDSHQLYKIIVDEDNKISS